MLNNLINAGKLAIIVTLVAMPLTVINAATDAERIAELEARLLKLEKRLSETEQETKEVKVLASNAVVSGASSATILGNKATYDILANSAWRNLRWTQEEQWDGIVKGVTEEQVVEMLGAPPRSLKSLKPRVDMVYWYENSLRDRSGALRGKISFKDGKVIAVQKPDFKSQSASF